MADRLIDLEGVGEVHGATLAEHGLVTTDDLLMRGARPAGRAAIAEKSGIPETLILEWVNHADLCRIKGVAGQYADLLEEAGVDTVVELSRRNPVILAAALAETNSKKNLTNRLPSESMVADWVAQAKDLPRAVFYESGPAPDSNASPATVRPVPPPTAGAVSSSGSAADPSSATPVSRAAPAPRTLTTPAATPKGRGWLARLRAWMRGR